MPRVAGADPGTSSLDLLVLRDGAVADQYRFPADVLNADPTAPVRWLHATVKPRGKWSGERVIVFTEYRATQNWLQTLLASEGFTGGAFR